MSKHHDYTRGPTPLSGIPIPIEDEPTSAAVLAPTTTVAMSLKTFVVLAVSAVAFLSGIGGTYFALASTDREIAAKTASLQKQIDGAATKQDLRALRLDIREDLLAAKWTCANGGNGTMECRIVLPRDGR
jgi:hypothetical protein